MKYVGGPRDIWTKCDPEVFWESVTKGCREHFKVSEPCASPSVK